MRTARGAKKFMLKIFHNKPVRRGGCGMNTLERCECQSGRAVLFGWKVQHLREVSNKMPQIFDTQFSRDKLTARDELSFLVKRQRL
jgi:hypothetical protein